jgi:hypothetical protein
MLIAMQRPDAAQVAAFRKWQERGTAEDPELAGRVVHRL